LELLASNVEKNIMTNITCPIIFKLNLNRFIKTYDKKN
jgi:hypothetical protein